MANVTAAHIRGLMDRPTNVRNMSVVGHFGHGKSTLVDALVAKAGITLPSNARFTDTRDDEKARGMTIKSTAVSLCVAVSTDGADAKSEGSEFLINLVDSPGHVDFSPEVAAALRITDGALVVVDSVAGVCMQTENVLRQALAERIKPVLFVNKVDRLLDLQMPKEEMFQSFSRTVESANAVLSTYHDAALGDVQVSPEKGTVAFGSGLQGWSFTLRQFARRYSMKFGIDQEKMMAKLWGDNFFDPRTNTWTTQGVDAEGKPLERAFNMFVLDPIYRIVDAVVNAKGGRPQPVWEELGVTLAEDEPDLTQLFKAVMRNFLPLCDSLLEMVVINLPSPDVAQRYRVEGLYEGPMDDESAVGIRECDPQGPLMLYVSKMVPSPEEKGRFYTLGRVFSGTVRSGSKVRVQGPTYILGKNEDLFVTSHHRPILMMGPHVEPIEDCPAGSIVGLVGIDQFLLKSGTVTSSETAHSIRAMRFAVAPVVQVAVEVADAGDLPSLVEGLKRLSRSDLCVEVWIAETGEHMVAGVGELHLEICLKDLEDDYACVSLKKSDPFMSYRETVRYGSSMIALSKSGNKHNRFFVRAMPLGEDLCKEIESGKVSSRDDVTTRARILADQYGWDAREAKKIWCFGPDTTGPNILVDATRGLQYLHEIKDSCVAAFQWVTREGVCTEENMRGVQFNFIDVVLNGDVIHRGGGQIIPACRRVCYAAALLATPGIQEAIYRVEIQCPESAIGTVSDVLKGRRGQIFSEEPGYLGTPMFTVKAYLPVAESFGFTADLGSRTQGRAIHQSVFHDWELMAGTPLEKGSKLEALVSNIRTRKGLEPEIPPIHRYLDEL